MINEQEFCNVLQALTRTLPRFKPWDAAALSLAWMTFPEKAKRDLTPQIWLYAAAQRRLDPAPKDDVPIDLQLLQYVYRQRDGKACIDWGLKGDLPARMANANRFHPQPVHAQLPVGTDQHIIDALAKHPASREFRNGRFVDEDGSTTNPALAGLF